MSSSPLDQLSASAVSIAVAGNTGVAPFLTLFLVSVIERFYPDLLNTGETMESWITEWPTITILAILTILEFVAKCVPVIDEIVDTAVTFIVPVSSVLATMSTMGLYGTSSDDNGSTIGMEEADIFNITNDSGGRMLQEDDGNIASVGALRAWQSFVVIVGVVLAVSIHFFKMLIRLLGEGWATGCLTVFEAMFCVISVTVSMFIQEIAVLMACLFIIFALYNAKRRFWDKRRQKSNDENQEEEQSPRIPRQQHEQQWHNNGTLAFTGQETNQHQNNWWDGAPKSDQEISTNHELKGSPVVTGV